MQNATSITVNAIYIFLFRLYKRDNTKSTIVFILNFLLKFNEIHIEVSSELVQLELNIETPSGVESSSKMKIV